MVRHENIRSMKSALPLIRTLLVLLLISSALPLVQLISERQQAKREAIQEKAEVKQRLNEALLSYAEGPNWQKVKSLLEQGAEVNTTDSCSRTALGNAALANGSIETLEVLLAKGADPENEDIDCHTALMLAAENRRPDMVSLLLKSGAGTETVCSPTDKTALWIARENEQADCGKTASKLCARDKSVIHLLRRAGAKDNFPR